MKHWPLIIFLLVGWSGLEAQIRPALLTQPQSALQATEPYKWSVYVRVTGGRASGVAVGPKVFLTAAHVVHDDGAWVTPGSIQAYWANHTRFPPIASAERAVGIHRWASYSTREANDGSGSGSSSIDTFNLDFAVVYLRNTVLPDGSFAPVMVDPADPEQISFIRRAREKTIVGYPADEDFIASSDIGRMHQNSPGNYETYWWADDDDPLDSESFWTGTHYFSDVVTYGGNSGGPVYATGPDERWHLAGVLVGGSANNSTIRALDAAAWELAEAAIEASGGAPVRRVETLTGEARTDGAITLNWTDRSNGESAYLVERRSSQGYAAIAELPANTQSWTDPTVPAGSVAHYRVTPLQGSDLRAPPSERIVVETPGNHPSLGAALGEPLLHLHTTGDAPMYPDGAEVSSGKIWGMEESELVLDLIGPGKLRFEWSVSSELNPDFNTRGSRYFGDIYDAFFFTRNGDLEHFISGLGVEELRQVDLPAGAQSLKWSYSKDPYSDEGEDRGKIKFLSWTPSPSNAHPYGARRVDSNTAETTWFGRYSTDHFPWGFHEAFGWLYFSAFDGQRVWAHSPEEGFGWLYVDPGAYPYLYSAETGGWLYYVEGTASAGVGGWFYDFKNGRWLRMR